MLPYLKCCAASVADQPGVDFEHIVVDGGSNDGTLQWLEKMSGLRSICEKDRGMYDAINKGLEMAKGDILAYLNCDEQYLPDTLFAVRTFFQKYPDVDIIYGDMMLTRQDGSFIAFRKGYKPRWFYILTSHLYIPSCTIFFRRKIIGEGFYFNSTLKANADADFMVRLLKHGFKVKHLKRYLAVFTMTGENLSNEEIAQQEFLSMFNQAPFYIRKASWVLNGLRLTEKFLSGAYFQKKPLKYSIYVGGNTQREHFIVNDPSFKWKWE
jgi:glycosyltransferase involved in cell wall biosynthesis